MAATTIKKGDQLVVWGVTGLSALTGIVTGGRSRHFADVLLVPDAVGDDTAKIYYNEKWEFEVEFICLLASATGSALPSTVATLGAKVTIAGSVNCLLDEITEMWSNRDVRKYSVKLTEHKGMTVA